MGMSFISYLINGLSLGSVYAIIALGYTMVYGIAKMLNFAHGDVIMIGAYTGMKVHPAPCQMPLTRYTTRMFRYVRPRPFRLPPRGK